MNYDRDRAIKYLKHYVRLAVEGAGLRRDGDNDAEMEELVDALIAAAIYEAGKLNQEAQDG